MSCDLEPWFRPAGESLQPEVIQSEVAHLPPSVDSADEAAFLAQRLLEMKKFARVCVLINNTDVPLIAKRRVPFAARSDHKDAYKVLINHAPLTILRLIVGQHGKFLRPCHIKKILHALVFRIPNVTLDELFEILNADAMKIIGVRARVCVPKQMWSATKFTASDVFVSGPDGHRPIAVDKVAYQGNCDVVLQIALRLPTRYVLRKIMGDGSMICYERLKAYGNLVKSGKQMIQS